MIQHILTSNGSLYHVDVSESELYHYGVPGMKWGQRKQRVPVSGGMRRGGSQASTSSASGAAQKKEARKAKAKKALKVGAAVAGTALAAYGAYKLTKFVQNKKKRTMAAAQRRAEAIAAWRSQSQEEYRQRLASMPGVKSSTFSINRGDGIVDTYKYRR